MGTSSRVPWIVLVGVFAVMAVAGPVKIALRAGDDGGGGDAGGTEVRMAGLRFAPQELRVSRGATVNFVNDDVAPHTVTADDQSIDSGTLRPGATFTLTVNGPFSYFCAIHPSMTAEIVLAG